MSKQSPIAVMRTSKATLTLDASGILRVLLDRGAYITLVDAKEMVITARRLAKGERLPILVEASEHGGVHRDARRYWNGVEGQSVTYVCAVVTSQRWLIRLINFSQILGGTHLPLKVFADHQQALQWLGRAQTVYKAGRNPNSINNGKLLIFLVSVFILYALCVNTPNLHRAAVTAVAILPIMLGGWLFGVVGGVVTAAAVIVANLPLYLSMNPDSNRLMTTLFTNTVAYIALGYAAGVCQQFKNRLVKIGVSAHQNAARIQYILHNFESKDYDLEEAGRYKADAESTIAEIWESIGRLGDVLRGLHHRNLKATMSLEKRVEDQTRTLKQMQNQLMQASKLSTLGTMSASLAHELNNPIAVMSGYLDVLREANLPDQSSRQVKRIEESLKRMQQTADHLRRFARQGRGAEYWRFIDLSQVVSDAFILLDPAIEKARIKIKMDLEPTTIPIQGDTHLLESVVQNLVLNSRDAFDEREQADGEPEIYIATSYDQNFGYLIFRDNAGGIPPAVADHVFDAFFTTKDEDRGTGLGLSIARGIVEQHGGSIELQSRPPQGTTFKIRLPLAPSRALDTDRFKRLLLTSAGKPRILILDDERDICDYLKSLLQEHFDVDTAEHPLTALRMVAEQRYDLIITDVHMPDLDGAEFTKAVQENAERNIPVLLISGLSPHDETILRAIEVGALGLISKPFETVDHVMSQIFAIVDKNRN